MEAISDYFLKNMDRKNLIDTETLKIYANIDGLKVIEEYIRFNGNNYIHNVAYKKATFTTDPYTFAIHIDEFKKMAHVAYGLQVNNTNELYVGMYLKKYYHDKEMIDHQGYVQIPNDILRKKH